jgi:hypothetical protein
MVEKGVQTNAHHGAGHRKTQREREGKRERETLRLDHIKQHCVNEGMRVTENKSPFAPNFGTGWKKRNGRILWDRKTTQRLLQQSKAGPKCSALVNAINVKQLRRKSIVASTSSKGIMHLLLQSITDSSAACCLRTAQRSPPPA